MGRKKTSEQEALATRERIIETAEMFFRLVGYSKTTVADIAKKLAMSPSNVYRYFPTKAHLNREICSRLIRHIESHCMAAMDSTGSALDRLKAFVLAYHRAVRRTIFKENRLYDMVAIAIEQHWSLFDSHREHILAVLSSLLAQGVSAGIFRDIDTRRVARAMQDALVVFIYPQILEHLSNEFASTGHKDSLEEQLVFLIDTFFRGICLRNP